MAKSKYEDLPEIPDYERPDLETYEKTDFDPTKPPKKVLNTWLINIQLELNTPFTFFLNSVFRPAN